MHPVRWALVACLASVAAATTLREATTCDLVEGAERVCCAVCESVEARVDPRTGMVFTHASFRLLEDLKGRGAGGATIRLRVVGGKVGNLATIVEGMPAFRPAEERVLFLGRPNDAGFETLYFAGRGAIRVEADDRGARWIADRVTGFRELDGARRIPLDEFREAVVREVRALERRRAESGR